MPSRSPGSTLFPYTTPSDLNSRTEDAHVGVGVQELHGAHERVLFEHGVWVEQEHVPSGRACQSLIAGARKAQILPVGLQDRKSTRLNSSHRCISYAVFCLKK